MIKKIILPALLIMHCSLQAQVAKKPADVLPAVQFTNLKNTSSKTWTLKASKAKLLLVEFWSANCGACIGSMARLAAMKNKFPELQVVLLTIDSEKAVDSFLKKRPDLAALGLPMKPVPKQWAQWFPYRSYPHVVWIGADNAVKAITSIAYVKEDLVNFYLKNGSITLPVKNDLKGFNYRDPLTLPKNEQELLYTSIFTGPIEGVSTSSNIAYVEGDKWQIHAFNNSMPMLYALAYRHSLLLNSHNRHAKMIWLAKDSSLWQNNKYGMLDKYCYELSIKAKRNEDEKRIFQYMRQDLDRFFNLLSEMVKKTTTCYVLINTDTVSVKGKLGGEGSLTETKITAIHARDLVKVFERLIKLKYPLVYEGSPERKVSLILKTSYDDVEELKKDIQKAGLDLVIKEKEIDVLVIRDR